MSASEQLEVLLRERAQQPNASLCAMQDRYRSLLEKGLITKQEYDLPPVNVFGLGALPTPTMHHSKPEKTY